MTLHDVAETAAIMKCSEANIYALLERKELGCYSVGANGAGLRISDEQIKEFLGRRQRHPGKDSGFPETNPVKQIKLKHLR